MLTTHGQRLPLGGVRLTVFCLLRQGDGEQWDGYSISYWHNRLNTNANWTFPQVTTRLCQPSRMQLSQSVFICW